MLTIYLLEMNMLSGILIGVTAIVSLCCIFMVAYFSRQRRRTGNHVNEELFEGRTLELLREQNHLLEQKVKDNAAELEIKETALRESLSRLESTRQQLVQREKMASLGELMAGIAHEIQNPLNFINNFSEVTIEMFEDLHHEQAAGNVTEAGKLQEEILNNLQKINNHGKRASSIVKGMLQHSRINSGQKEMTNINELTEECVQLIYQGTKAKDKSFQLKLNRDFQEDLPLVSVVPQEIGRVIINLVSNAIYSVKDKKSETGDEFEPEVTISTALNSNHVNIKIKDNGKGIAPKVADKIFQPFFTTKPNGQGTGLGLSLSYEIVKAHNGEITISSEEGNFAEFVIQLPV